MKTTRRRRRRRCEACGALQGPDGHPCPEALRIAPAWRLARLQAKAERLRAVLDAEPDRVSPGRHLGG